MELLNYSIPPSEWNQFVFNHPESKLYHTLEWLQLIQDTFKHETNFLVLQKNNEIEGIFPSIEFNSFFFGKFAVSLPFVTYGGPLLRRSGDFELIIDEVRRQIAERNLDFFEIRFDKNIQLNIPQKRHKVTFILDLPSDPETLFSSFKAKLRNQIRRPMKENMYVKHGDIDLLDDFYKIFSINMRDLGTPVYPKCFFNNILEIFHQNAFVVVVYSQFDQPAAAALLIQYREKMEIPWASSIKEFNKFSPNMLLYWESLKLAIQRQCNQFDFGRCSPGSGTYRFKKQWGAQERQLYWYYVLANSNELPELNPDNPKYKILIKIWQNLPLPVSNFLGPHIIKNIP